MHNRAMLVPIAVITYALSTICVAQGPNRSDSAGIDALVAKANAGNPEAEFKMGVKYELGAQVPKDPSKAAEWYRKAAEKGYLEAQHSLGVLYEFGNGVPLDYATAAQWYSKAADKGFAPAEFSLGLCYVHGKGVPQDYDKALYWYQKAAEQRNSDALSPAKKFVWGK